MRGHGLTTFTPERKEIRKCSQSSHIYERVKVGFFFRVQKPKVLFHLLKRNKTNVVLKPLSVQLFWTKTGQILSVVLISGGLFISRITALEGRLR